MGNSAEQGWLFRQGDLVIGPVPASQIIDKLYSGQLNGTSEVRSLDTPTFRRLSEVGEFHLHLAKAEVQHRVTADHNALEVRRRLRHRNRVAAVMALLVVVAVAVAALGSYLAVYGSFRTSQEVAWGDISIDETALVITRANRRRQEELFDYQGPAARRPEASPRPTPRPSPQAGGTPGAAAPHTGAGAAGAAPGKPRTGTADPDGLELGEVDQEGINAVIAQRRPTLVPCLKEVAKPGVFAKIPIEFSIAEGGRVSKVWVDNPDFKDGPLTSCLLRELQKWPFKPAQAGATVQLAFNIGKKQ